MLMRLPFACRVDADAVASGVNADPRQSQPACAPTIPVETPDNPGARIVVEGKKSEREIELEQTLERERREKIEAQRRASEVEDSFTRYKESVEKPKPKPDKKTRTFGFFSQEVE